MSTKFYDIEPSRHGSSHYLMQNGIAIARYSSLGTAEKSRDEFVKEQAEELERNTDRLIDVTQMNNISRAVWSDREEAFFKRVDDLEIER